MDLSYLRPWANHIITDEEARTLTAPVTRAEIKQAFFDIDEDKAPGPDGYSAGFYKAAWPVIGDEIMTAVEEFFANGRLLKQVNATLLALIPKVQSPTTVADFRPISCCNVLYKAITKILILRLRPLLSRLVSPTQNAFIPGRLISDNILLAQELFAGYNQQRTPPRCAMKVDLRKAYDTVEWDFLIATLQLFGFPNSFIKWIEECVTTSSFSVCLNGSVHGFFGGARGLRQGDPMSPYLFVLVMEVLSMILQQLIEQDEEFTFHWKCRDIGLFQLSFADDLLLFSSADESSVGLFQRGLQIFAGLSGLCANPAKSQLIISKSAHHHRDRLLHLLGFQEGTLPVRYLGLPLISSRLTYSDCQPLLHKIEKRISTWVGVSLTFAARVQLIKSVLMAFNVYWGSAFILPKGVVRRIESLLRTFLWKGNTDSGYAKVAWKDVCLPMEEGGQGISDIQTLNYGLMCRRLWDVVVERSDSIWVTWVRHYRLRDRSIWTVNIRAGSWAWRKLIRLRILTGTAANAPLHTVILDGDWNWPTITDIHCLEIVQTLPTIHNGEDCIRWRATGSVMMSRDAYAILRAPGPKVAWYSLLLGPFKIPRNNFVLWLAILQRLSTLDRPWLHHGDGTCILCSNRCPETHSHLFFRCQFARQCLTTVRRFVSFPWLSRGWEFDILWAARKWRGKHVINAAYRALLSSLVYHIWQERNRRRFQQTERTASTLGRLVVEEVRQRIISAELSCNISTIALYRLWKYHGTLLCNYTIVLHFIYLMKFTFTEKKKSIHYMFPSPSLRGPQDGCLPTSIWPLKTNHPPDLTDTGRSKLAPKEKVIMGLRGGRRA
ncbi:UNVERIFIED_CONTAM: LINE-1 retrotransposable element O protein [Sesamum latifolium]|uniref:LINE-1 retrotransposable element O protein n=1 Tax=Sesamum latifolium TaxID=2727402 RepID=A0AAW2WDX7_9LAMI